MVMIVNEEEGRDLLTMRECIDLMEDVFREIGRGASGAAVRLLAGAGRELPGEWFSADLEPWFARGYSPAS